MTLRSLFIALPLVFAVACGDDGNNDGPKDGSVQVDAGTPDASCFENPTTHKEIINACTNAVKVFKDSHPPLLNADGTLPSLPP